MSLLIIAPNRDVSSWADGLRSELEGDTLEVWPEVNDPGAVTGVACWNHPHGELMKYPNLKIICSLGAGVDHILSDPHLPEGVPVTRIIDKALTYTMTRYLLGVTLSYHRRADVYMREQKAGIWNQKANPERELHIGIMGMGVLGKDIAKNLATLGFKVSGYSNTRKNISGVNSFAGDGELNAFLKETNFLINLLPLTKNTRDILNLDFFKSLPRPVFLVNVARGGHLVEEDLLEALDRGLVSGACLDVFRKEPLPQEHPFWKRSDIFITPHIASITNPEAAIPQISGNYKRVERGEKPENMVDRNRGY